MLLIIRMLLDLIIKHRYNNVCCIACVVMWILPLFVSVGAELAPPVNLTMITLNTDYILSWDWDQSSAENQAVNFTTQYLA